MRFLPRFSSTFVVLLSSFWLSACTPAPVEDDNSDTPKTIYIAVFGDIQYYTEETKISLYKYSLNWIQKKANEGKVFNCILHTGDITMNNYLTQWELFAKATSPIAQEIPFLSMIGDHDYTWDGPLIYDRLSTCFNDFVQFPLTKDKIVSWFEEGRMENVVVENTIYGQRLDLLVLEFGPRDEVVAWADSYVKSHPNHLFIVMNHEYLESGGGRREKGLKCAARLRNTTYNTPTQLWDKLIKCNDNIRMVLCGHSDGLYAITFDTNDYGREILQIQHNIQDSEFRYGNWLMLWEFPPKCDSVNVSIINTRTEQYYNNQTSLVKFKYRDTPL